MASNKIHIFRKSAMEPLGSIISIRTSEKLMSKASDWKVVEHEDAIEMIFNQDVFGDNPIAGKFYNYQAIGDSENKDDDYSYIVNTDFLNFKEADGDFKNGISKIYFPKIKAQDHKIVGVQAK
ncbi:hypothetical protein C5167_024224 [Papaver somniferum]|uniref:Uncharacterized protein n=1 Tax=Papaver somniferum TaxID=3469 RepID=A0A4Y7JRZ4_PAPSO|nr:uncharacterized protein LOC113277973 [Papaver somniferum]RZC62475.1 hypothetical protein C5167_024224 [Papaver somniferum]